MTWFKPKPIILPNAVTTGVIKLYCVSLTKSLKYWVSKDDFDKIRKENNGAFVPFNPYLLEWSRSEFDRFGAEFDFPIFDPFERPLEGTVVDELHFKWSETKKYKCYLGAWHCETMLINPNRVLTITTIPRTACLLDNR